MSFTVVATSAEHRDITAALLPYTRRVASSADRLYFIYQVDGSVDYSFTDLDGHSLIEVHSFVTLAEAEAWVVEDARQRQAPLSAAGGVQ